MTLCSSCSVNVKPVVAIDIDGTMGLYHNHFVDFAEVYLNTDLRRDYDGTKTFWAFLGLDLVTYRQVKLAYRLGGMKRSMPIRGGAKRLFDACHRNGAEVWITTTRPYLRLDNTDPDTQHWLERHGLKPDYMLYDEDKYGQLFEMVDPNRVVAIIEDLPEQLLRAGELFGESVPIVASAHHNTAFDLPFVRHQDLSQISYMVDRRLQQWKEDNAND